jgi:hypothetical protein
VLAAALVSGLLLVTFDLDRPTRGLIEVPDTPLTDLRASMATAGGHGADRTLKNTVRMTGHALEAR